MKIDCDDLLNQAAGAVFVPFMWTGTESEPLRNATVEWHDGIITSITEGHTAEATKLPHTAIIPTLVNAHCHLEFSQLTAPHSQSLPFCAWIAETMQVRRENASVSNSIVSGRQQSHAAGVGLLAEIVTQDVDYPVLTKSPELMLFHEVIGLTKETAEWQQERLQRLLRIDTSAAWGISPHAPYTVPWDLLQHCVKFSAEHGRVLMIHLAETLAERELIEQGGGELVEMLLKLNLWDSSMIPPHSTMLDYLHLLSQADAVLLAHGNYLNEKEITFLAGQPQMNVVFCPRTHAYFQHTEHPWPRMLDVGVNVALGTDGRGSNPDLNLWEEAHFLFRQSEHRDAETILKMATINGGRALGRDLSLKPARPARWTFVSAEEVVFETCGDLFTEGTAAQAFG